MMKPDPPARWTCSSSPWSRGVAGRRRLPFGFGKKKSNGSMPKPFGCIEVCLTTSVEVMETTAGATREAMSANDGIATEVTGALADVVWIVEADCAFDFRIRPRSALMTTPKTTDAMTIAIVDRMRLVREFINVAAPYSMGNAGRGRTIFALLRA